MLEEAGGVSVLEALQQASENSEELWEPFDTEERRSKL